VIKAALARAKADAGEVEEVILGQVLTANKGQKPARQAAIKAGGRKTGRPLGSTKCAAPASARWRSACSRSPMSRRFGA
jgi:acetyl-CoA acetyltransferase